MLGASLAEPVPVPSPIACACAYAYASTFTSTSALDPRLGPDVDPGPCLRARQLPANTTVFIAAAMIGQTEGSVKKLRRRWVCRHMPRYARLAVAAVFTPTSMHGPCQTGRNRPRCANTYF